MKTIADALNEIYGSEYFLILNYIFSALITIVGISFFTKYHESYSYVFNAIYITGLIINLSLIVICLKFKSYRLERKHAVKVHIWGSLLGYFGLNAVPLILFFLVMVITVGHNILDFADNFIDRLDNTNN